jgi:hypothetical protein
MWRKTVLGTLAAFLVGVGVSLAADPNLGTWKLNEAKSKIEPGAPKNTMVKYEMAGDAVKVTVDGVDKDGKPAHTVWTGKYDGKDYPVTGVTGETRAYTKVDDHTVTFTGTKDGKPNLTGKVVVAADGKSRVVTVTLTQPDGKKSSLTATYDKQ